jgi:S-adenosylmethionine uptake transporter
MALASMAGFALFDAVVRSLGTAIPTVELIFFRFSGGVVWLALYIAVFRRPWPQWRYMPNHALRAALTLVATFCFFYAFARLPLALVTALAMTAPIYVGVLGALFLRERITTSLVLAVLLALLGSLVVVFGNPGNPFGGAGADPSAWLAATVAPFAYAVQLLLLKTHSVRESAAAMTLAQAFMVAAAALPLTLAFGYVAPEPALWPRIVLLGLLGTGAFLLIINALRRLPASVFSLADYTALLWAALFGFLFFGEVPGLSLWIGGALIVTACVVGMRGVR